MRRLENRRILVTGGSHGIGEALVRGFCQQGAQVVFTYHRSAEHAFALRDSLRSGGAKVEAIQMDCAEVEKAPGLLKSALEVLGDLDVLVNNVGMIKRTPFVDIAPEEFAAVFAVNFNFPFFLSQAFVRHIQSQGGGKTDKSILNISSLSSTRAVSRVAHYQCSKAALAMLTKSIAIEVAELGIRVNTISPGLTATEGNRDQRERAPAIWSERVQRIPLQRAGAAEDHVGAAILFASSESAWITGADLIIDGGQSVI